MKHVVVKKVVTRREMDDFVRLAGRLYRDCPQYVPDLDMDVRATFSPKQNTGLVFCDIQPFVAYADGEPVGRIAGIINHRANEKWNTRCVRFGFIEFVDDGDVSGALLAAVEQWGREHGMQLVQGPMGITDFDKEGMLVEDFHLDGSMMALYNPAYYPAHLESRGYRKTVDWLQVRVQIPSAVPAKYQRVARLSREMFGLTVRKMTLREAYGYYGRRAFELLNEAYAPLFGFTAFTPEQMKSFTRKYLLFADRQLMPVIENAQGDIVGVAVTMGSLSQALRKSRGRLLPLGWWHLLRSLYWKREGSAEMLLVAVRPDYQGLGLNALFFDDLIPFYNRYGIRWAETGPQLEDNVRVLSQWAPLHPEVVKRRRCYEKEI